MTIKVYQFPNVWGINPSPFGLKLDTYLRLADVDYDTVTMNDPRKAPKGKLPFIEHDGQTIGDSGLIIDYVKDRFGDRLDSDLGPAERATMHAVRRLFEENYYFALMYARWGPGWPELKTAFFSTMPPGVRHILGTIIRRKVFTTLRNQGIGRHSEDEIFAIGTADLTAAAALLGDKPFFMRDRPTSIDATTYGFLANTLAGPFEMPLKHHAAAQANIVDYCERIRARCFAG